MGRILGIVVALIVLLVLAGGVVLAFMDVPPQVAPVEKTLPNVQPKQP